MTWREGIVQAIILLALLTIVFPKTFLHGEVIFPGDILFESLPWSQHAPPEWKHAQNRLLCDMPSAIMPWYWLSKKAVSEGEWPLWNPQEFGGAPLLANWQSAVFYPPRLLHMLLNIYLGTTLYVLLKLWLCGMTAYLCARGMKLGVPAARFLSVAWMLNGYNLVWCNWPIPDVSVWLPIVFLGTEWLIEGRRRQGFLVVLIGATLSLFAGHPESAFIMNMGVAAYAAIRLAWERRSPTVIAECLGLWIGAWSVALLVSAVQVLPFVEYLANSKPPHAQSNMGAHPGLPARALACLWAPRFFGATVDMNYWGELDTNRFLMVYAGIPVWIGAMLAVCRRFWKRPPCGAPPSESPARIGALLVAGAVFFCLTFEVPPFDLVHRWPVFSLLKRTYYIAFVMFALPVLAAMGLDRWFAERRKLRALAGCALGLLAVNLVLFLIYRFFASYIRALHFEEYLFQQCAVLALIEVASLGILAASCTWRRPAVWSAMLTVLLAADLLYAGRGMNVTCPAEQLYPDTPLTRFLQDAPKPGRIGTIEGMIPNGFMVPYGLESISGYDGIYPKRMIEFQYTMRDGIWNAMEPVYNIVYYLHDRGIAPTPKKPVFPVDEPGRYEHVASLDGLEVYKNNRALPRAFLVGHSRVEPDFEKRFDVMRDPSFDPAKEVLVETPLPGPALDATGRDLGHVAFVERAMTRVVLDADASGRCILVLGDAYFPGWKATVDGKPTEVFPAYQAFRGIVLPEGKHRVEFAYRPLSFYGGLAVSTVTLSVSVLVASWWLLRNRRATALA